MSNEQPLRVGVIGVGSLGQAHARLYAGMKHVQLVGVYDVDPARAREIAAKHGTQAYDDMDELAAAVDAASIVVPTDKHFEVFGRLAARGLHLLVEKPIAASTEEAEQMLAIARQKGIVLQVGHVERFNPVMDFLEANLQTPKFIEVIRLAPYPPPRPGAPPRGTEVSVVLDLMIHDLDIILQIVRSPVHELHAIGVPVMSTTEDIANARIVFENGCVANVTASRISMERMRKIRVFQENSYVSLDYMNQEGQLIRKTADGIHPTAIPIEKREPLLAEIESFTTAVTHRRDPVVTGQHGYDALELAIRICRHIRETPS